MRGCGAGHHRREPRQGPEVRGQRRRGAAGGRVPGRQLPPAEEARLHGVPPRESAPAPAHQHHRRRRARALAAGLRHAQLLPGSGLPVPADAAHHRLRLRGRGRDVPREHPALPHLRAAAPGGRPGPRRLRAGLLRGGGLPHGLRPAERGDVRVRPGRRVHLRPHLPRGELPDHAPPGGVQHDRAGDGVCGPGGRHGQRRGLREARGGARSGALRGGPAVLPAVLRQGPHGPAGTRARPALRARGVPRGRRAAAGGDRQGPVQVAVPGRGVRHGPADGARAVAERGQVRHGHLRVQLPAGHQGLLHAGQRGRGDRGRHGPAGAWGGRADRGQPARGAAGRAAGQDGGAGAGPGGLLVVPGPAAVRVGAARGLRAGVRAAGVLRHGRGEHPRGHRLPPLPWPRRVLGRGSPPPPSPPTGAVLLLVAERRSQGYAVRRLHPKQ
mmetsp:Transcript_1845/g.2416  ORF Transcript_1845/g.2416 Transcript_1845/m.2416 type:complete len:441 (+) Transcript_1845:497-1819(+)